MKNQITKGKIKAFNNDFGINVSTIEGIGICAVYSGDGSEGEIDEAEANAELIAEAFNVTNECGFTPAELLAQRNEFLEIANKLSIYTSDKCFSFSHTDILRLSFLAQQAINNATK